MIFTISRMMAAMSSLLAGKCFSSSAWYAVSLAFDSIQTTSSPMPIETGLGRKSTCKPNCLSMGATIPEFSMARIPPSKTKPLYSKELTNPPVFFSLSHSSTFRPARAV